MKRIISAAICMAVLSFFISGTFNVYAETDTTESISSFTIVHTNDIHGYYKSTSQGQIGYEKLKTLIDKNNAQLVLDAGDTFHGQAFATIEQGESVAQLMDAVGYDAVAAGNHDFSYGIKKLRDIDKEHNFSILAANIMDSNGNPYFENSYIIKQVTLSDGKKIDVGVVGVSDDDFSNLIIPEHKDGVTFTDEEAAATKTAEYLRKNGCEVVVAIGHLDNCRTFAENTSDIDIVIAGHEHILVNEDRTNADGKKVHITEANCFFQNAGILTVNYNEETGEVQADENSEKLVSSSDLTDIQADSAVANKISEIENSESTILSEQIGTSSNQYPYSWEDIRVNEQPLGHIVTSAYIKASGADVAIENAGGIRGGIPNGMVTYKDIIGISPYGNCLVTLKLTGKQLLNVVEHSIQIGIDNNDVYEKQKQAVEKGEDPYQYKWSDNSGNYLQFSGIKAEYNKNNAEGSRIVNASINGKALNPEQEYTVITNNYLIQNSEYPDIQNAKTLYEYGTCEQALISYIKAGKFELNANENNFTQVSDEPSNPESSNESSSAESSVSSENENSANSNSEMSEKSSDSSKESKTLNSESTESAVSQAQNSETEVVSTSDDSSSQIFIFVGVGLTALALIAVNIKKKRTDN